MIFFNAMPRVSPFDRLRVTKSCHVELVETRQLNVSCIPQDKQDHLKVTDRQGDKKGERKTHLTCAAVFILIAFLPLNAFASVEISASVKPKTVTIGDRFGYEIVIRGDDAAKEPPLRLDTKEPFEILDAKILKIEGGEKKIVFTMAAFKTGKLELPVYEYEWVDSEGNPKTAHTPIVFIEVKSVLPENEREHKPKDIGDVAKAELDYTAYAVPLLVFILAVIAAAALIYYLRKGRKPVDVVEVKISPFDAAMERLEKVKRENLYAKGQIKGYFTQLSDTVRIYIEDEFGVEAMELTTWELSRKWPNAVGGHKERVILLLETCDLAKFSKSVPSPEDAHDALGAAFRFVEGTKKAEEAFEAGAVMKNG